MNLEILKQERERLTEKLNALNNLINIYSEDKTPIINKTKSLDEVVKYVISEGLNKRTRVQHIAHQRFYLMYYLRTLKGLKYREIAEIMGVKQHDVVMYGVKQHVKKIKDNDVKYNSNTARVKIKFPLK